MGEHALAADPDLKAVVKEAQRCLQTLISKLGTWDTADEPKRGPAGNGASAAAYLNEEGKVVPKRPAGTPSGRPSSGAKMKKPEINIDPAEEERWTERLKLLSARQDNMDLITLCASYAAQLTSAAYELAAAGKSAGLDYGALRTSVFEVVLKGDGPLGSSDNDDLEVDFVSVGLFQHSDGHPGQTYEMQENLGEGAFGSVCKGKHKVTGQTHAIKAVPKEKINPQDLWAEIDIMKQLDHPHIMRLHATFEDESKIYMASEICSGGEFFDTIEQVGYLEETACKCLFRQILSAVNYLHCKRICHRDLKPENFLVSKKLEKHDQLHLKLIDFGTAKSFADKVLITKICTAHYVAPEVLKHGDVAYTEKVDIWSCGVILYMMLCGFMPFHHENAQQLLRMIKKGKYNLKPNEVWDCISDDAKQFIQQMLCVNVEKRLTAGQALYNKWCHRKDGDNALSNDMHSMMMTQMKNFVQHNRLKHIALQIIARNIQDDSIEKMRSIFLSVDGDCSGTLSTDEMDAAFRKLDVGEALLQEMREIMHGCDIDGSGFIEYTEFIAATMTKEMYGTDEVLWSAFHILDIDGDGFLSEDDLRKVTRSKSRSASICQSGMHEMQSFLEDIDQKGEVGISFEEFRNVILQDVETVKHFRSHRLHHAKERKSIVSQQRASLLLDDDPQSSSHFTGSLDTLAGS